MSKMTDYYKKELDKCYSEEADNCTSYDPLTAYSKMSQLLTGYLRGLTHGLMKQLPWLTEDEKAQEINVLTDYCDFLIEKYKTEREVDKYKEETGQIDTNVYSFDAFKH